MEDVWAITWGIVLGFLILFAIFTILAILMGLLFGRPLANSAKKSVHHYMPRGMSMNFH